MKKSECPICQEHKMLLEIAQIKRSLRDDHGARVVGGSIFDPLVEIEDGRYRCRISESRWVWVRMRGGLIYIE